MTGLDARTPAISIRGVRFAYTKGSPEPTFSCPALDIGPGLSLLQGPNGSGKSTLLKLAAGVEQPDAGVVTIRGHDLWTDEIAARQGLAYVPEQPDLSPYATIGEVVRLVARLRVGKDDADSSATAALAEVGLLDLAHRTVRELSMGQRRRAIFAAALIGEPAVILLDEPLEMMDRDMRRTIVDWLRRRIEAGAAAVVATHELEPFSPFATRAISFHEGSVQVVDPLPPESRRRSVLDALARGHVTAREARETGR